MKTPLVAALLFSVVLNTHTQTINSTSTASPPASATSQGASYVVVQRDANSRIWERTTDEQSASREMIPRVHRYTELATGMHYQKNGQWVESKEEIDLLPQGGAAATQGQYQVYFPGDIYQGQIELVTPDGEHLHSRPMGISYDDGSNTVLIAQLKDSVGELVGSNRVVYPDAFTDFKADLVCTYRRGGFESDVVFREEPSEPQQYGLNPRTSRLQLLTEFYDTPEPTQSPVSAANGNGLSDPTLQFGKTTMEHGRAFSIAQTNQSQSTSASMRVYKSWLHLDGRTFLVEQLPYQNIRPELRSLPAPVGTAPAIVSLNSPLHKVSASRLLAPSRTVQKSGIQMARANEGQKPGLVLDYTTIDSDQTDYTFQSGTTYYITGPFSISGTTIFQDAVIKYAKSVGAEITVDSVECGTTLDHPAVFTSVDDDSAGQQISGISTGSPAGDGSVTALDVEHDGNTVLQDLRIFYAGTAINCGGEVSGPDTNTIRDVEIAHCGCGFYLDSGSMIGIDAAYGQQIELFNGLISDTGLAFSGYFWGGIAQHLTVDGGDFTMDWGYNDDGFLLTNCVLANVGNFDETFGYVGVGGEYNGFYNCQNGSPDHTFGSSPVEKTGTSPFASSGVGNYYLAQNEDGSDASSFRDQGTTGIDSDLLTEIETMTTYAPQGGGYLDNDGMPDLGFHYPVDEDHDGLPDWWEWKYFGTFSYSGTNLDSGGVNTLLYDYTNGIDPNQISFSLTFPNQYVSTNIVGGVVTILAGVPSYYAVLVDSTNFSAATWSAYTSSNISVNLGSTQGSHDVWLGLRGLPSDAQQTWQETTLVFDSLPPTISITNPVNNASFNAARIDVHGNFTAGSLKDVTVNGVLAFVNGTNFAALGVPLSAGSNAIVAVIEDFTGATNAVSINVNGLTNSDGSMNDPVQFGATPIAGFAPLAVTFQITSNSAPGTFQQAFYDFNGDGIADLVTNSLGSFTNTYATNGEYFPVVTLQTSSGYFSSSGGWNSADPSRLQINVQSALTQSVFASVTDPVDLKWAGTNLYVLSGSGATITEFNTNASTVRSLAGLGTNPSGFDVDAAGNVYIAITSSNQVWKFTPTNSSFVADTNFGIGGRIGLTNGSTGTGPGEFNAPFDVAVSPDGGTVSVSDSGNNRIQDFAATNGTFIAAFGTNGSDAGQFNTPKGLTYDGVGTLYIVDSGNDRIAVAEDLGVVGLSGTNGNSFGQFNSPANLSVSERGIYVADSGNNRIQCFSPLATRVYSFASSDIRFAVATNLNQPAAIATANSLTNEIFYVADKGNNRVLLYQLALNDPTPVWNSMTNQISTGDISGADSNFSIVTADQYRQAFLAGGTANIISVINQTGALTPVSIKNDTAEYYFEQVIAGQTITFPVDFVKENGVWKILEF